jgi:peptidoglycan hydrolase CwlO-like protein
MENELTSILEDEVKDLKRKLERHKTEIDLLKYNLAKAEGEINLLKKKL